MKKSKTIKAKVKYDKLVFDKLYYSFAPRAEEIKRHNKVERILDNFYGVSTPQD